MTHEEMMKVDGGGYYGTERAYEDRNTAGPEATGEDYAKAAGAVAFATIVAPAGIGAAIMGAATGYQAGDYFHGEVTD